MRVFSVVVCWSRSFLSSPGTETTYQSAPLETAPTLCDPDTLPLWFHSGAWANQLLSNENLKSQVGRKKPFCGLRKSRTWEYRLCISREPPDSIVFYFLSLYYWSPFTLSIDLSICSSSQQRSQMKFPLQYTPCYSRHWGVQGKVSSSLTFTLMKDRPQQEKGRGLSFDAVWRIKIITGFEQEEGCFREDVQKAHFLRLQWNKSEHEPGRAGERPL